MAFRRVAKNASAEPRGSLRAGGVRGFALLEVLISMVILGVAVAALMRSFMLSLQAVRRNEIVTIGCMLSESLMQDFERNPPSSGRSQGNFAGAGYPTYFFEAKYAEDEPKYRGLKMKNRVDNYKVLRTVNLKIIYDDGRREPFTVVESDLVLAPTERFAWNAKFFNELFYEDESGGRKRR